MRFSLNDVVYVVTLRVYWQFDVHDCNVISFFCDIACQVSAPYGGNQVVHDCAEGPGPTATRDTRVLHVLLQKKDRSRRGEHPRYAYAATEGQDEKFLGKRHIRHHWLFQDTGQQRGHVAVGCVEAFEGNG